ncbi:MAG TPA: hypothetical protein VGR84_19200 [Candidatus Acidoferrales bacterium]|nr:hypothetical protein [Candidatus Acidoferrales bacterium]
MRPDHSERSEGSALFSLLRWGTAAAIAGLIVLLFIFATPAAHKVHAQLLPGAPISFSINYSTSATATDAYVPACTATVLTNCIPNSGQVADTVTFTWNTTGCSLNGNFVPFFELDGSNDGATWFVLSASSFLGQSTGTLYSNGYFTFKRLAFVPCHTATSGTVSGVYTGYGAPLPVTNYVASPLAGPVASSIGTYGALLLLSVTGTSGPPFFITGIQCYNPNAAVVYLDLSSNPTFNFSTTVFQLPIPATSAASYSGPPIIPLFATSIFAISQLYGVATTSQAGNVQPGTNISCSIQVNTEGPFYPFNVRSPL